MMRGERADYHGLHQGTTFLCRRRRRLFVLHQRNATWKCFTALTSASGIL
jgi:hypothetical protein